MTAPNANWPTSADARTPAEAQTALVLEEYGDYVEPGPPTWPETDSIRYFVRKHFVLVRDEFAERAREILEVAGMRRPRDPDLAAAQQRAARLRRPGDPMDGDVVHGHRYLRLRRRVSVDDALKALREGHWVDEAGRRRRTHDPLSPEVFGAERLLHLTDHSGGCPADEPTYVPSLTPPDPPQTCDRRAGQGIRVVVVDTGLDPAATALPWMAGVTGDPDPGITGQLIGRYAGHGTFIAGVIRSMAPAAEVIVRAGLPATLLHPDGASPPPGTIFERELATVLERCLVQDDPDIISLSAGTLTEEAGGLLLLDAFYDNVLRRHKGVVVVAAAGNDAQRSPFWPAAGHWAVGVGALAANWRSRASFSNFGGWVDVYAPGERLVNAFASGTYTYSEPPRKNAKQHFDGMAVWSGTSFSTPIVAGLIAARMSRTGENGTDAAAALIAQARRDAIPGVGAVLLPPDCSTCGGDHSGSCSCRH